MPRGKVKLAWIPNDSARRSRFNRRKKGLLKKVEQLSILCDVKACAIVYGPNDPYPEVWPSVPDAEHLLSQLKSIPTSEKSSKMFDQEKFLQKMITKVTKQLDRKKRENHASEINRILRGKGLQDVLNEDVIGMNKLTQEKILSIQKRMDDLKWGIISEPPEEDKLAIPMQRQVQTSVSVLMQIEVGYVGSVGANKTTGIPYVVGALQEHQCFANVINCPHGHSYYVGDDWVMPYGNNDSLPGAFFSG